MPVKNQSKIYRFAKSASYLLPLNLRKRLMDPVYGHFVFSKFKEAQFDEPGWKYVVPEPVAKNFAQNFKGQNILDAYAGVGGTSIQLALQGNRVTSFEINPVRFKYLEHNAKIYRADNLKAINADVQEYLKNHRLEFDAICVDPPWKDIKTDFAPYVKFFSQFAPVLVFSVSKTVPNETIFNARASEVREVYVNQTLFHKEAFFYRQYSGEHKAVRQVIGCPEVGYLFP